MADLLSYLMPGTGNWSSGTSGATNHSNTTKKYFNPQAIIDQQNAYRQMLGGTQSLNNLLLYGKGKKTPAGTPGPYKAPTVQAPPAQTPAPAYFSPKPHTGGTPAPGTYGYGATPTPAVTPDQTPNGGGAGGGGNGEGIGHKGPEYPTYPPSPLGNNLMAGGAYFSPQAATHGETPAAAQVPVHTGASDPLGNPIPVSAGHGGPVTDLGNGQGEEMTLPWTGKGTVVQKTPAVAVGPGPSPGDPGAPGTVKQHPVAQPGPQGPIGGGPGDTPPPDGGGEEDPYGGGGLLDVIQQLISGGGYSDAEKQAIAERAAEATAAQKASAQAQMSNHLASSGNAAGYAGAMASLDNSAAQTASDQARQNTIDFANEAERRKELGGSALQALFGTNTAANLGLMGQASGLAGLDGGQDTSGGATNTFENHGFQATPDASANKPATKPGTGSGGGGGANGGGKNGVNPNTGKIDPNYTPDGTKKGEPDHNGLKPGDDGYGEISPGDSVDKNGNHPGDPDYDPYSDPTNPEYDPNYEPVLPPYDPNLPPEDPGIEGGPAEEPPPTYDPPPIDDGGDPYGGGDNLKYDPLVALRRLLK